MCVCLIRLCFSLARSHESYYDYKCYYSDKTHVIRKVSGQESLLKVSELFAKTFNLPLKLFMDEIKEIDIMILLLNHENLKSLTRLEYLIKDLIVI